MGRWSVMYDQTDKTDKTDSRTKKRKSLAFSAVLLITAAVFVMFPSVYAHDRIPKAVKDDAAGISGGIQEQKRTFAAGNEPGPVLIGSDLYYISPETLEPVRDTYVGSLYFGGDRCYTSGNEMLDSYTEQVIRQYVQDGKTREELLRDVYLYTRDSFSYRARNHYEVGETGWEEEEALTMFSTGRGNCYSYAAVFCCLARALGYDAEVVSGLVGSECDPHGWVKIEEDGRILLFDPEIEMYYLVRLEREIDLFAMEEDGLPWPYISG